MSLEDGDRSVSVEGRVVGRTKVGEGRTVEKALSDLAKVFCV